MPHHKLGINENVSRKDEGSDHLRKLVSTFYTAMLKSGVFIPLYANSTLLFAGKKAAMNPTKISAQSAPKRYGIHEVKSYLDWQAKSVNPMKSPAVSTTACRTILDS